MPPEHMLRVVLTGSDPAMSSPLRGKVIEYLNPTEPVAQEDWITGVVLARGGLNHAAMTGLQYTHVKPR